MAKTIIILTLTVVVMFVLAMYEAFGFLYYEENKANMYSAYGAIPILIYFSISLFLDRYKWSLKDNRFLDATKYSLYGILCIAGFYYLIMIPVISGAIIVTNDVLQRNEKVLIEGIVIDKTEIDGTKLSEYEITVKANNKIITWDTNKTEASKFQIGDTFVMEMKKGFWGLLTKDK